MSDGGLEQRQLHEFLNMLIKKGGSWGYYFAVIDEELMGYWKPMTGLAKTLMEAINTLKPNGERDASEYFLFTGHLQMWCDSHGWDWRINLHQPDVFHFARLAHEKLRMPNGQIRVRVFAFKAEGMMIYEYYREERTKEKERGIVDASERKSTSKESGWKEVPGDSAS